MKRFIRNMLFGDPMIRQYATVEIDGEIREKVYLRIGSSENILDISGKHWLLGMDPLIFGVWVEERHAQAWDVAPSCTLYFRDEALRVGEHPGKNDLAIMKLDLCDKIQESRGTLLLLEVRTCRIHHVSFFKTHLLYAHYFKGPNFPFSRLKSLAAAFTYPREVSVVSFGRGEEYNIFPMDLLGEIPETRRFVFGLRHTNRSLPGILREKKIVVAKVPAGYKTMIYQLGANHQQKPPEIGSLPFGVHASRQFGFWVPAWAVSYREIRILRAVDIGSQMLLWGECEDEEIIGTAVPRLYHIHFLHYLHQKARGSIYPGIA